MSDLQFERAEFAKGQAPAAACRVCASELRQSYFAVNGQPLCRACCDRVRQQAERGTSMTRGLRARRRRRRGPCRRDPLLRDSRDHRFRVRPDRGRRRPDGGEGRELGRLRERRLALSDGGDRDDLPGNRQRVTPRRSSP